MDNVLTLQTEALNTNTRLQPKGCGVQMSVKVCGPLVLRTKMLIKYRLWGTPR